MSIFKTNTSKTFVNTLYDEMQNNDVYAGDASWTITRDPLWNPQRSPSPKIFTSISPEEVKMPIYNGMFIFIWSKPAKAWAYWGYGKKEQQRVFNQWGVVPFFCLDELILFQQLKVSGLEIVKIFEVKKRIPVRIKSIVPLSKTNMKKV